MPPRIDPKTFLAAASVLAALLAPSPSMAKEASVESEAGLRQFGFGARAFLFESRRGPDFGGGLDYLGLLEEWYGAGAQVVVVHTPVRECVCVRSALQGMLVGEARALAAFPLTPYGRAGLGGAQIEWSRSVESDVEFIIEKKLYFGTHLEGGLDVHHLGVSLRVFGFVSVYPALDLAPLWPAVGAQFGGLFDIAH
jgi:hypothetical protein